MSESKEISVSLPGREELHLNLQLDNDQIVGSQLKGVGSPELLNLLVEWRPKLQGSVKEVPLPDGISAAAILLREVLQKAKGEWDFPVKEEELCHCRAIETKRVDMAVITGAHHPERVSELTSASTACGTCRPDVEAIIEYRLKVK